jgi:CubicO group peptidase (beta-lactamase class C family)
MILGRGVFGDRRYLSENAVTQMTSKQTGDAVEQKYGLGWSIDGKTFGHGGAYSTNMTIDPARGLIMVFLVQHAGYGGPDGDKVFPTFMRAAIDQFGK